MIEKGECNIIEDLLLSYVDETLNVETKQMVEKHLLECDNCKKKLEDIKANIVENENIERKHIDYLKRLRKKERRRYLKIIMCIILLILSFMYLCNFIKFNHMLNKANKSLQSNNIYIQSMNYLLNNEVSVIKRYYKDGKYKETETLYSGDSSTLIYTKYATVDSTENIYINEVIKKVTIQKGEMAKIQNSENNLKFVPFVNDNRTIFRIGCPAFMFMNTEKFNSGSYSNNNKKCYVLNYVFDKRNEWEIWLDRETGLPLLEINRNGIKTYYDENSSQNVDITYENVNDILKQSNDILKEIGDSITEYKYQFDIVTDEDVKVPDFTSYEIEYIDF